MRLENTVAKNDALMENIWMMAICIGIHFMQLFHLDHYELFFDSFDFSELRIPLFLVGKPGSSKSLAKTTIVDAMQGVNSYSELFKKFKEIHCVSFQCSPLATAGKYLFILWLS